MGENQSATITAFGDILLHGRVYGGINKKNNFKFDEQLSNVGDLLGKTDLTIGNLETVIAGTDFGLSSFPKFNGPSEIAFTLKRMGVDIVTIANNHALDQGAKGLLKSINNIEKSGLFYDGAYKSKEDSETLRVFNINGLKVCFISYTQTTNGIETSKDKEYMVNKFKNTSVLRLSKLMRKIKSEEIADAIILNLHFGEEYHLDPSSKQKEQVKSFADAGANVIIGHHPHVLQPPEWIETSRGLKTFVAYSLGNFFTGQLGLHRQIGAVLSFKLRKPDSKYSNVVVESPTYNLTYVNRTARLRFDIYKLKDWVKANEYIETSDSNFLSNSVYEDTIKRMQVNIEDLKIQ